MMRYFKVFCLAAILCSSFPLSARTAYVANGGDGTVGIIDTDIPAQIGTIFVGGQPRFFAITPDGSRVYVIDFSTGNVIGIDTSINQVIATIPTASSPNLPSISPDGNRLYVPDNSTSPGTVYVIDINSNQVIQSPQVGESPRAVAITPDSKKIYVANSGSEFISVIDATTLNVTTINTPGYEPQFITISPDGKTVYATGDDGGNPGELLIVDTVSDTLSSVTIGVRPLGVSVLPNGEKVFIGITTPTPDDAVNIYDVASGTVSETDLGPGSSPFLLFPSPNSEKVYVLNAGANRLDIVDGSTGALLDSILSGAQIQWLDINCDGTLIYAMSGIGNEIFPVNPDTNQPDSSFATGTSPTDVIFLQDCVGRPFSLKRGKKNTFLTQTEYSNRVRWSSSATFELTRFDVYRDDERVGSVPNRPPYEFVDHNVPKNNDFEYTVVGIVNGGESVIVPINP